MRPKHAFIWVIIVPHPIQQCLDGGSLHIKPRLAEHHEFFDNIVSMVDPGMYLLGIFLGEMPCQKFTRRRECVMKRGLLGIKQGLGRKERAPHTASIPRPPAFGC